MATLSPNNHGKNAPWWWKRTETALIGLFTGLIPLVGLSSILPEPIKKEVALVWLPAAALITKLIGVSLGSEDKPPKTNP